MTKVKLIIVALISFLGGNAQVWGQEYSWEAVKVDGHMTGCISPSKDNVPGHLWLRFNNHTCSLGDN